MSPVFMLCWGYLSGVYQSGIEPFAWEPGRLLYGKDRRTMRIGILGGSFNPVHVAHLIVAEEVRDQLRLDKVVLIPARVQPHKPAAELADADHRLEMVCLAVEGNPALEVSDIELLREGPSYSVDTMRELREGAAADDELFFIIGSDTVCELPAWKDVRRLVQLCDFVVVSRPGWALEELKTIESAIGSEAVRRMAELRVEVPPLGISSTDIRRRVRQGRPIRYMVPNGVAEYIEKHQVYR